MSENIPRPDGYIGACEEHNRELVFCGTCLANRLRPWITTLRKVHDAVYTQMTSDEYHDAWMEARALLGARDAGVSHPTITRLRAQLAVVELARAALRATPGA